MLILKYQRLFSNIFSHEQSQYRYTLLGKGWSAHFCFWNNVTTNKASTYGNVGSLKLLVIN